MNTKAQSIVEYILIATLVILGMVFMGPYVLRSIGANFKMWDEGVRDSYQENIRQAPINDVPTVNVDCECPSQATSSCGSNLAQSQCAPNQRIWQYNCTPQNCNHAGSSTYCVLDPSCCSTPVGEGCGSAPLTGTPATTPCPSGIPNGSTCYTPPSDNCYYGETIESFQCGGNSPSIACVNNACSGTNTQNCCSLPQCRGFALFPNATPPAFSYCPGAEDNLTTDITTTYVASSANCSSSTKCQAYCNPPYILIGGSCNLGFTVAAACCSSDQYDPSCDPSTNTSSNCYSSGDHQITNNQNFTACLNTSSSIASASVIPVGTTASDTFKIDVLNGGCGNPGVPEQSCVITVSYGSPPSSSPSSPSQPTPPQH